MPTETPASFLDVAPPNGWDCRALGDLLADGRDISYGIVQPGQHDPDGVPIVRVNNIRQGRIETEDVLRVAPSIEANYERTRLRGGEVLLTLVGTLGECAIVPNELAGWNVARAVAVIPLAPGIDARWVAVCLRSQPLQHLIRTWATTTVQATLNLRDVRRLPIVIPPPTEVEGMMRLIGGLDDKIELNRRMNRTLEALARAVFRAWFVDFEPVKVKAAGATSFPGMPQPVFDQLPRELVDSELGAIPAGWECAPIGELVEVVGGATPSTEEPVFWEGGEHPFCTPKDMSRLSSPILLDTERHITDAGVNQISSGQLPVGTVLLSSRAPIGYLAVAATPVSVNQGIIAVPPCAVPSAYVFFLIEASMETIKARAGGSTFAEISKRAFRPIPALRPAPSAFAAFDEIAQPYFSLIENNERESTLLVSIRDSLLPKLISGEVRVGESANAQRARSGDRT